MLGRLFRPAQKSAHIRHIFTKTPSISGAQRSAQANTHLHGADNPTYLKLGSDWPIFGFFIGLCAVQLGMTFAGHSHMRLGDNQFE